MTANQVGACIMMLIGALLLLIGIGGLIPIRAAVGEDGFEVEFAEQGADEGSPEQRADHLRAAQGTPEGDPLRVAIEEVALLEYQFHLRLSQALPEGCRMLSQEEPRGFSFDAIIEGESGCWLRVEYKSAPSTPIDKKYVDRLGRQAALREP